MTSVPYSWSGHDDEGNVVAGSGSLLVQTPPSGPILGMNFESVEQAPSIVAFNAPYEPRAEIARIYVSDGRTNIASEDEFERAADLGITQYVFSCKDTTTVPGWYGTVPSWVTRWYAINHHEPEDDIHDGNFTLAQWQAWQALHLPAIRQHGGSPWLCLMSYTVNPASGRNVVDYKLPAGLADGVYWDYYPNKEPKPTQAQTVARMRAGMISLGLARQGTAEYGIQNGSIYNAATVDQYQALTTDHEVQTYWSNQQAQNQKFTPSVADAWFS